MDSRVPQREEDRYFVFVDNGLLGLAALDVAARGAISCLKSETKILRVHGRGKSHGLAQMTAGSSFPAARTPARTLTVRSSRAPTTKKKMSATIDNR